MSFGALATVRYLEDSKEYEWSFMAHAENDNERTLRRHLKTWRPKARFLGFTMEPWDKPFTHSRPPNSEPAS